MNTAPIHYQKRQDILAFYRTGIDEQRFSYGIDYIKFHYHDLHEKHLSDLLSGLTVETFWVILKYLKMSEDAVAADAFLSHCQTSESTFFKFAYYYVKDLKLEAFVTVLKKHEKKAEQYLESFPPFKSKPSVFNLNDESKVNLEAFVFDGEFQTRTEAFLTRYEIEGYYFRYIQVLPCYKISDEDYSAFAELIRRTNSTQTPVLFTNGIPTTALDEILNYLNRIERIDEY